MSGPISAREVVREHIFSLVVAGQEPAATARVLFERNEEPTAERDAANALLREAEEWLQALVLRGLDGCGRLGWREFLGRLEAYLGEGS